MVAVRPVRERAAATEALPDEFAVDAGVDQVARRRDLRARRAPGKIAARIRRRRIELQRREREVVEPGHASTLSAGRGVHAPSGAAQFTNAASRSRKRRRGIGRAPKRRQVRGLLLAVDQREPARAQYPDEVDERDLRRVGLAREHRFAEEHAADRDAVETARRGGRRATPRPNARSRARAASQYASIDRWRDPGAVLPRPRHCRAPFHHFPKRGVGANLETLLPHKLAQRARDAQLVGGAGPSAGPGSTRGPARSSPYHGKMPCRYASTSRARREVRRRREQSVGFVERGVERRKGCARTEPGDHATILPRAAVRCACRPRPPR